MQLDININDILDNLDNLDISKYPELLYRFDGLISEFKSIVNDTIDKINSIKNKIILDIDSERDTLGNRVVKKYSTSDVREARLYASLESEDDYLKLKNSLEDFKRKLAELINMKELIRRKKQVLLTEYQNHGIRTFAQIDDKNRGN